MWCVSAIIPASRPDGKAAVRRVPIDRSLKQAEKCGSIKKSGFEAVDMTNIERVHSF